MTKNLIFSLCRNESSQKNLILANEIISQILNIIQKNVNNSEVSLLNNVHCMLYILYIIKLLNNLCLYFR